MHQVYVDIIVDAIIEQYQTEENFYSAYQIQAYSIGKLGKKANLVWTMKSCKKLRICLRIMSGC